MFSEQKFIIVTVFFCGSGEGDGETEATVPAGQAASSRSF